MRARAALLIASGMALAALRFNDVVWGCPCPLDYASKPVLEANEDASVGLRDVLYDVNEDGKPDLEVLTQFDSTGVAKVPLFYIVDEDGDGSPDKVWVDRFGTGACEDLVLYEDLQYTRTWNKGGLVGL